MLCIIKIFVYIVLYLILIAWAREFTKNAQSSIWACTICFFLLPLLFNLQVPYYENVKFPKLTVHTGTKKSVQKMPGP